MNKIRLNLDALAVETFATTKDRGAKRGTVRGHDSTAGTNDWTCWDCTSHSGLDGMCWCQPANNTNHISCGC